MVHGYADTWTVAGEESLTGYAWDTTATENDMTAVDGTSLYYLTKSITLDATSYSFKVVKDHAWTESYGDDNNENANRYLTVDVAGTYDVTFWFNTETHDVWATYVYSIKGNIWDNWATDKDMTQDSQNPFVYTLVIDEFEATAGTEYSYKLHANHAWADYELPSGENKTWTPTESGKYKLTFTADVTTNDLNLNAEKIEEPHNYTVVGVSALLGEEWATTSTTNVMTEGADGKFTLTKENVMLLAGNYSYKVWRDDNVWIPSDDNRVLEITDNGYYTVTFTYDPETQAPTAEATLTEAIGYLVDFNTTINTGVHDFAVSSNWKHIVPNSDYDGSGPYYMSYSYSATDGIDGTGTLVPYRQYAGDYEGGEVVSDILVTPVLNGKVKMFVKPSGLASSANPSFIEIYKVNEAGTEAGDLIQRFIEDNGYVASAIDGWYTIETNLTEAQRIGLRVQYAYLDNFMATEATIVPEAKLVITNVASPTGSTPYYVSQKADGSVDVELKVTLQNTGEVDLVAGTTENFTLNPVKKAYYGSTETAYDDVVFDIPVSIAMGETKEVTMTFNVPNVETGWLYWKVKENISGSTSSAQVQSQVQEYASKFIFDVSGTTYYSSSSATTTAINFGKVTEETTVNYEIYNSGSAPLVINSFTLPEPFTSDAPEGEFTVTAGEKYQIAISMPATTPGVFAGNLEIVYTNYGKAQTPYTLGISGTVIDTSKNWITFSNDANDNGQFPAGSIHSDEVYISKSSSEDNWYLQSTSTTTKFITPLLTAAAGESFTYDAWYSTYIYSCAVKVYTSTDRINWTQVDNQTYSSGIGSTANTFTVTIPEAGNYYLGFELISNALIDNIYGLTLAPTPEHDWYVIDSNVPTTGTQNADYTATVSLKNISADADVIETATLYVDGEAVATVENVALEGNDKTAAVGTGRNGKANIENPVEVSVTYKPHTFGTFPAYIELKSGDAVVTTEEVSLVIAEETVNSEAALDGSSFANKLTVVAPYYNHSGSESLLTAEVLESMGITNGAKISRVYVNGYNTHGETTHTTMVWMGNTDATELSSPFEEYDTEANTENLNLILNEDHVYPQDGTSSAPVPMLDINFSDPFVYTGGSIRIVAKADIVSTYKQVYFQKSNVAGLCQAYSYDSGSKSYSSTELPAFHFELVLEPTTMAGTVTDGTNPVEGATVTIRNAANDVEYATTTDAEGKYTINVIQDKLAYKAVANKEGFVSSVLVVDNFENDVNMALTEFAYGQVWSGSNPNADLSAAHFANMKAGDKVVVSYDENPSVDRNVRFTKPNDWNAVYVYAWDANDQAVTDAWPGLQLTEYYMNEYDQQVYNYTVPENAVGIVFNDGASAQTADITNFDVTGYYLDNGELKSWTDNNTAINLCADNGNVIAEGTLADGTVEFELTEELLNSLTTGLIVNVKGTEANITKVELVELEPITITMSSLKYATLYYENVNLVVPEGLVAYAAVVGDNVTLKDYAVAGDIIPAGTPVVLAGEEGTYKFAITTDEGMAPMENDLIGSENGGKDDDAGYKYYVLNRKSGVAGFYFQKGSAGAWADVRAHSAYLKVVASQAKAGGYGFDDVATSIDSIDRNALTDNDSVFTLSGVRVHANRVAKGVYIVNGQKVVIK